MRIAAGLHVDAVPGGGVRVRARDWPNAVLLSVPPLVTGLPLAAWAGVTGHGIELGGALVFVAFGGLLLRLGLAERRDLTLTAGAVRGTTGAGPFARAVDVPLPAAPRLEIRPFPTPDGAPELEDRGGDLVVLAGAAEVRLARRTGPGWREILESAMARASEGMTSAC